MPCVCEQCVEHGKALGLAQTGPSKVAIRKAYKVAAKRWHPDRFGHNEVQRLEAEEHFKLIQVAYRELSEHFETPQELPVEDIPVSAEADSDPFARQHDSGDFRDTPAPVQDTPSIFFGNAARLFYAPQTSRPLPTASSSTRAWNPPNKPLAFVDLSPRSKARRAIPRSMFC